MQIRKAKRTFVYYKNFILWRYKKYLHSRNINKWDENVIVIRTHVIDDPLLSIYKKCVESFKKENVYILFDATNNLLENELKKNENGTTLLKSKIISVTETMCRKVSPLHKNAMYSASAHVMLSAAGIRSSFQFMWLIEGDVYCHGDIKKCLECTLENQADFLAKPTAETSEMEFRTYDEGPNWPWWSCIEGRLASVPLSKRKGCFFPIIRCSKLFLNLLDIHLPVSSGYCEVYFPTLCDFYGLKLSALPPSVFGEFQHRPALDYGKIKANPANHKLYHPVKSFK